MTVVRSVPLTATMNDNTIIITGASGFIGSHLVRTLAKSSDTIQIVATFHNHESRIHADLRNQPNIKWVRFPLQSIEATDSTLQNPFASPPPIRCVIHCAALADLAHAERDPALAHAVNVRATAQLAELARENSARFIFFSTDQVFDGKSSMYTEDDSPSPINQYARTKVEAESAVRSIMSRGSGISLRIGLVYGSSPTGTRSASEKILHAYYSGDEPLALFVDEFRTPTYVGDITECVSRLLEIEDQDLDWPELLHIAGPDRITRFELGVRIAELFSLDQSRISPISQKDLDLGMPRPPDLSLEISLARTLINYSPHSLMAGLRDWKRSLLQNPEESGTVK